MDDQLAKHSKTFKAGSFIFTEEGAGDKFYIVKEGTVELLKNTETGVSHIGSVGPGEVLGELALVDEQGKRSASARAASEVTCLEFDEAQFDRLLKENENFRETIINLLTDRLRTTSDHLANVLNLRDKLHQATVLLLYFMSKNNWFDHSRKRVPTDLPINDLSSFFRLRKKDLREILDHPSSEHLQELPVPRRESLQDTSEEILDDIIDAVVFEDSPPGQNGGNGEDVKLTPKSLKNNLESIHDHLKNREDPLDEVQIEEIEEQLIPFEERFDAGDSIEDEELRQEIKSHVKGIKETLSELTGDG